MWQQWINGILGLWVIVLGFTGLAGGGATTILAVTGIVIAILGFWGAIGYSGSRRASTAY